MNWEEDKMYCRIKWMVYTTYQQNCERVCELFSDLIRSFFTFRTHIVRSSRQADFLLSTVRTRRNDISGKYERK